MRVQIDMVGTRITIERHDQVVELKIEDFKIEDSPSLGSPWCVALSDQDAIVVADALLAAVES